MPTAPDNAITDFVEIRAGSAPVPYDMAARNIRKAAAWCWASGWVYSETPRSMVIMDGVRGAAVHVVYSFTQAADGSLSYSIRGARHMIRLGAPAQHNQIDNWAHGRLLQDCIYSHFTPEQMKAAEEGKARSYKP